MEEKLKTVCIYKVRNNEWKEESQLLCEWDEMQ